MESNVYPIPHIKLDQIFTTIQSNFNTPADHLHQSDHKTPQNIRHKKART